MTGMSCFCIECGAKIDHLDTKHNHTFGSWEYVAQGDEAVKCPHCRAVFTATLWGYDEEAGE